MKNSYPVCLLLIVWGIITLMPTGVFGFQFNPAVQPFVPFKQKSTPRYPAPDFTLLDADGASMSLSDNRGSVVALMFWTTW